MIGGGSAAAAIQASYLVRTDPRGNRPIIGDRVRGFGFLKNAAVDIHVLSWNRHFDLLEVVKQNPDILGIGIDADAAIVVHGNEFRVLGVGNVAIYDAPFVRSGRRFYFLERGERFDLTTRTALTRRGRPLRIPAILTEAGVPAEKLAGLAGEYDFDGMPIIVSVIDGRLFAGVAPDDRRELIAISEDRFVDAVLGSELTFRRGIRGQAVEVRWEWPRCTMIARRRGDR